MNAEKSKYSTSNETGSRISSPAAMRTHSSLLGAFACSSTKSSCLPLGLVRDSFRRTDRSFTGTASCERRDNLSDKPNTDVQSEKPVSTTFTSKTASGKTVKAVQTRLFPGQQNDSPKISSTTQDDKLETEVYDYFSSRYLYSLLTAMESLYSLMMKSLISVSTFMLVFLIILYHAVDIQPQMQESETTSELNEEIYIVLFNQDQTFSRNFCAHIFWGNNRKPVKRLLGLTDCQIQHDNQSPDRPIWRIQDSTEQPLSGVVELRKGNAKEKSAVADVDFEAILSCRSVVFLVFRQVNPDLDKMLNTMWLIAVTFLSIGYGDVVPNTHCGRSISVIAGVMLRHSAANVLRETWLFYKHTRLVKRVFPSRVRRHQRKFLQAINRLRRAKDKQRKLKEDANSMVDLVKLQTGIHEMVSYIRTDQAVFVQRLISVEKCMNQLQIQLNQLPETLTGLLSSPMKRLSDSTTETVALSNINKPDPGPNDP
ncbi:potassium intermediate/small conductance calcium-activated channel subfamily N member 3 [Paragonimus westermani]|uniref:Potassium intermediate/small conductance calcium-activated channel subfamily N member 3 n=1 Tax=Paragonimus westermani TaxID=34504 RepID=A0A5J4NVI8_9TREM|nr:potassium intermediate/small conductance calcium-activated channel subfamily N member 3 [Paragonimus westermani]